MQKRLISEHIFLFSFAWWINEKNNRGYNFKPQHQIQLPLFNKIQGWSVEPFTIDTHETYNEFVSFYKPVRTVLYPLNEKNNILNNYSCDDIDDASNCLIYVNDKEYNLNIKRLSLRMVKSGVGILSIYLQNYNYETIEDMHAINSLSECVYPLELPIQDRDNVVLPNKIIFNLRNRTIAEDRQNTNYMKMAGKISPFIMDLLGETFSQDNHDKVKFIVIEPIIGSKMVGLSLHKDNKRFEHLAQKEVTPNHTFKEEFISTDKDRYYLLSPFFLRCVSREDTPSKIYDQMMTLLLIHKASLLNFSNQIATISMLSREELVIAIQGLYEIYIQFINQMYFDEITEDVNASWVYRKVSETLHIKEEIAQLDFEMKEVHEFAELITRQESNLKMEVLSLAGAGLVVPTFITGFFGMNILSDKLGRWWEHVEVLRWMNTYVILPVLVILYYYSVRRTKSQKLLIVQILLLLAILISLIIVVRTGCGIAPE